MINIKSRQDEKAIVVSVKGRLDTVTAPELEKELTNTTSEHAGTMVINMSEVEYISSAGLRVLLVAAKMVKNNNGEVLLCGLQGPVKEVLDISGFSAIFKTFDSEEAALATVK